jgi:hypothetical protein
MRAVGNLDRDGMVWTPVYTFMLKRSDGCMLRTE